MIEFALPAMSLGAAAVTAAFSRRRVREATRQRDAARLQVRQWQMDAMELAREGDRHRVESESQRRPTRIVTLPPLSVLPKDEVEANENPVLLQDQKIHQAQEALQARMRRRRIAVGPHPEASRPREMANAA